MQTTRYTSTVHILMKRHFFNIFSKNAQISNFIKMRPMEAELFLRGRTDKSKLIVAFRYFTNAPQNWRHWRALLLELPNYTQTSLSYSICLFHTCDVWQHIKGTAVVFMGATK